MGEDERAEPQRRKPDSTANQETTTSVAPLTSSPVSLVVAGDSVEVTTPTDVESDAQQNDPSDTDTNEPEVDPLIGITIGKRYEVISLIGHGATTSVYKAHDTKQDRSVALKILHSYYLGNEPTVRRFKQEAKTLGFLKHHNIISLYDSGVAASRQPYLVMEYAEGTSLKDLISRLGCIERTRAIQIFIQVCAALTTAHAAGIIHRDLKPANIMVTAAADGTDLVKILDFGVSKLMPIQGETFQTKTQTGEMLGTLAYMSPEQCLDQDITERSDIYSLGCVMYETLTGTMPLYGRTAFETMNKHMTEMPKYFGTIRPDLHLPKELEAIVWKAIAKDPKKRYQSASKLEDDLKAFLENRLPPPMPEKPPQPKPTVYKPLTGNSISEREKQERASALRLESARRQVYADIAARNQGQHEKYMLQQAAPNNARLLQSQRNVSTELQIANTQNEVLDERGRNLLGAFVSGLGLMLAAAFMSESVAAFVAVLVLSVGTILVIGAFAFAHTQPKQ